MNPIQLVLVVLLVAAVGAAFSFFRRMTSLEGRIEVEGRTLDEKRSELTTAKKDAAEHKSEVEQLRKQLQEAKSKLADKKKSLAANAQPGSKKQKPAGDDPGEASSGLSVVHISDQELEAQHRLVTERLGAEIEAQRAEIERLKKADERRKAETERATQAIMKEQAPAPEATAARTPEEQVEALKAQLEAFQLAANERERSLKRDLKRAENNASSAHRRANSNQSLYQVIKGQLEIAEDRLALFRRKYEGAKKPESIQRPKAEAHDHGVPSRGPDVEVAASPEVPDAPTPEPVVEPRAEG